MGYVVGSIGIVIVIFIVVHLRPLTKKEIISLSLKRRNKQVLQYFSFDSREFNVNKDFKKKMNPNGTFYQINENLFEFPSLAAALLKYKKHEWIIVAFERNKQMDSIWLNKGFDRSAVSLYLSIDCIADLAKKDKQTSVLILHNHPNANPNYYDCRRPSDKDIESASDFAQILNHNEVNLLEFVCEKGRYYEYFRTIADSFLPLEEFFTKIQEVNGETKFKNLLLHIERILSISHPSYETKSYGEAKKMNEKDHIHIDRVGGRYTDKAIDYVIQGQYDEAFEVFKKLLEIEPNYDIAYNWLGKLFRQQGKYKEAITQFETYIKLYNESTKKMAHERESDGINPYITKISQRPLVKAYVDIAECYLRLGNEQAFQNASILAEKVAKDEIQQLTECDELLDSHKNEKARSTFKEFIEYDLSQIHLPLGYLYALQGKLQDAIKEFQKAVDCEAKPEDPLGQMYLERAIDKHIKGEDWLKDMPSLAELQGIIMASTSANLDLEEENDEY